MGSIDSNHWHLVIEVTAILFIKKASKQASKHILEFVEYRALAICMTGTGTLASTWYLVEASNLSGGRVKKMKM